MILILHAQTRDAINSAAAGTVGTRCAGVVTALGDAFGGLACSAEVYDASDNLLATVSLAAWSVDTVSATKSITTGATTGSTFSNAGIPALVLFRNNGGTAIFEADAGVGTGSCVFQAAVSATVPVEFRLSFTADPALDVTDEETPVITPGGTATLPTTIVMSTDDTVVPTSAELVTFGVPVSAGQVTNLSQVRVTIGGVEQPIAVAAGLRWHWLDNSYRSVTVQMVADMTGGDVTVVVSNAGRVTANDRTMQSVMDGYYSTGRTDHRARPLLAPRVYALHDLTYLAASGLTAPFLAPKSTPDAFDSWLQTIDDGGRTGTGPMPRLWTEAFPYDATTTQEAWLYDRATTLFVQSMATGQKALRKTFLKHAAMSKQHYWGNVVASGTYKGEWIDPGGGSDSNGDRNDYTQNADTKYFYTQAAKLSWALLGDSTQFDESLCEAMLSRMWTRSSFFAYENPLPYEHSWWTERQQAVYMQLQLNNWEMFANPARKTFLDNCIANLRTLQTEARTWDLENGWLTRPGYWEHSWLKHEGSPSPKPARVDGAHPAGATVLRVRLTETTLSRRIAEESDLMQLKAGYRLQVPAMVRITAAPLANGDGTYNIGITALPVAVSNNALVGVFAQQNNDSSDFPYGLKFDRAASPWMTALMAECIWSMYCLLPSEDQTKARCRAILYDLGWAMETHAYDSTYSGGTYTRKGGALASLYNISWTTGADSHCRTWYGVNQHMSDAFTLSTEDSIGFSDTHAADISQMLSYAYIFEPDASRRAQLASRLDQTIQWTWSRSLRANGYQTGNCRIVSWRDRSNPYRTWKLAEQEMQ